MASDVTSMSYDEFMSRLAEFDLSTFTLKFDDIVVPLFRSIGKSEATAAGDALSPEQKRQDLKAMLPAFESKASRRVAAWKKDGLPGAEELKKQILADMFPYYMILGAIESIA